MTSAEKMLKELRQRSDEPMVVRLLLAEVARVYGDGFAAALQREIEAESRQKP